MDMTVGALILTETEIAMYVMTEASTLTGREIEMDTMAEASVLTENAMYIVDHKNCIIILLLRFFFYKSVNLRVQL